MLVKLTGKADIFTEYNGIKYSFTVKNPIKDIPIEVYDFVKQEPLLGCDLAPYFGELPKKPTPVHDKPAEKPVEKPKEKVKDEKPKRSKVRRPSKSSKSSRRSL